jgi:hypothetical protein
MYNAPLIEPSAVVLYQLDTIATSKIDPDGAGPKTEGYDWDLREPLSYETVDPVDSSKDVKTTVRYKPAIRIPCQVEVQSFEKLRQVVQGDVGLTNMVFVMHRDDLRLLGLLGSTAGAGAPQCGPAPLACNCVGGGGAGSPRLKKNDKITAIEKVGEPGTVVQSFSNPLFIVQIMPGSWGMGHDGTNLYLVYTSNRPNYDTPGK